MQGKICARTSVAEEHTALPFASVSDFSAASLTLHTQVDRPTYEPQRWNHSKRLLKKFNCVGYALNLKDLRWVIPGFLQAQPPLRPKLIDPEDYDEGFRKDGLVPIDPRIITQTGNAPIIASYFSTKWREAHSFRLDDNGKYSYKDGDGLIKNTDISGRAITDLDDADLGSFTIRIGYYTIPREGIHYL